MKSAEYNYPQSSTDSYQCESKKYNNITKGNFTNMSVLNCTTPKSFQCYNTMVFRNKIEPNTQNGVDILNPQAFTEKYAKDFTEINCSKSKLPGEPKTQYISADPRLISVPHAQSLVLDRPPIQSNIRLSQLTTDKKLNNYGQNYSGYSSINAGQIMYYVDKSIQEPFYNPNFSTSTQTYSTLYKDPMDSIKPQYVRKPFSSENPLLVKRDNYRGGLSWIQDSMDHREDIISRQMSKINRERYESRWY
jgi:hypothetical protein